jgi:hypothetical protein
LLISFALIGLLAFIRFDIGLPGLFPLVCYFAFIEPFALYIRYTESEGPRQQLQFISTVYFTGELSMNATKIIHESHDSSP